MKQIITLPCMLGIASLVAQPTIQFSDVPTGATMLSVYSMTDPGSIVEPSTGANQTWDFSSAQFAMVGTAVLGTAVGTPYAATYPTANWTWAISPIAGAADYLYMVLDATGIENVATHVPAAPNVYTDRQRIMQFPFVFGTSFTDAYASPDHTGTETWTYEGQGTLITSIGTFTNQLKLKSSDGDMVVWNASPLYPRIIANSSGVMLFGPSTTGVAETGASLLAVFPVPATTSLNITGITGTAQWRILDLQGRTVLSGQASGGPRLTVDVASLDQGQYLLSVEGATGRRVVRFQKQ